MSYKVRLDAFEGPFDLLVYLIENAQMEIYDIQVSEITTQYMEYLDAMREMDVYVGAEFMVLAATLLELKSRMILPRATADGQASIEEDPRSELVARLLEYKRCKRAAAILQGREEEGLLVFEKPQEDISAYLDQPDEYLKLDLKQFAAAFRLFLQKKQAVEAVRRNYTRVERERARMEERIHHMAGILRSGRGKVFSFKTFIAGQKDRYDIVVTFMSLLEMVKEHIAQAEQKTVYGDIRVRAGKNVDAGLSLVYEEEGVKREETHVQ